jgi:phosphate transport system substrate-binding protein
VSSGAVIVPVTAGSIGLAYNLPGVPNLKLSREAYAGIFNGDIKKWNDPRIAQTNPGVALPNLTLATVVRQDGSGTTFAFTRHLDAISSAWHTQYGAATLVNWPGNSMRASGNEGVASLIKVSLGSIGYVGYEFAIRAGLSTALLQNRSGNFVPPGGDGVVAALTAADASDLRLFAADPAKADAYPLVTLTWILLYRHYQEPQKSDALYDLFRWCLTDGQQYSTTLGYTPLPANIRQRAMTTLDELRRGVAH